jgi:hypothetical protein
MNGDDGDGSTGAMGTSPDEVAQRVIRKAKRRVAMLGWTAMILWIFVAGGFVLGVRGYFTWIHPKWVAIVTDGPAEEHSAAIADFGGITASVIMTYAYVWAGLVVLAATSTLLYVRFSQTAKLRQIRASLGEISSELERLAHGDSPASPEPPAATGDPG